MVAIIPVVVVMWLLVIRFTARIAYVNGYAKFLQHYNIILMFIIIITYE